MPVLTPTCPYRCYLLLIGKRTGFQETDQKMTSTVKMNNIQKHLVETQGFYFAKVTMFKQDSRTGSASDIVETYEGFIKESESGIIWMIRPQASMRSRFKTTILTVSERVISVEKAVA
jgi:hypothetical protein